MDKFLEERIAEENKQPLDISDPELIEKSNNKLG